MKTGPVGSTLQGWRLRGLMPDLNRLPRLLLGNLQTIGLGVVLVAVLFPASPPTAEGIVFPDSFVSPWNTRIAGLNVFEILMALLALGWLARSLIVRPTDSAFDRPLLVLAFGLLALQGLSLPGSVSDISYLGADLERVGLLAAAYIIVTRCIDAATTLRTFTLVLCAVILLRSTELVIVHGLLGDTQFITILGRSALLITEDTLLLLVPVALAWGALVDGRLSTAKACGAIGLVSAVFVIDLLGLRRGAILFTGAAIAMRSLTAPRRALAVGALAAVVVALILVALGPGRTVADQVIYTVRSSVLASDDSSSDQRLAELQNFGRNVDGPDWLIGRGVGVLWRAEVSTTLDSASFGSGESSLIRLGWHIYGLDWAYKFGLIGVGLTLLVVFGLGRLCVAAFRSAGAEWRWLIYSLGVCAPPFLLLAFTNPRVALMAGILLGLLSRSCDLAGRSPITARAPID